jgi:DNA modification methylase
MVMGRSDYHYKHEPIWYGWKPGAPHTGPMDRKQTTVLEFDRPTTSKEHPTMKPVDLIMYSLEHSKQGVVLDPFAGSGSTLIAAHRLGLSSRLVELDPKYCDVICDRFRAETGLEPVLEKGR